MTSTWPPRAGLTTPIMPRENAVFQISASIEISAPAIVVWKQLLDTAEWSSWNTFVPRVKIKSQPDGVEADSKTLHVGTIMVFEVVMDPAKPNKVNATGLKVVDLSTPDKPTTYVSKELLEEEDGSFTSDLSKVYRASWKLEGGYVERGLKSQRFNEIIITGENTCELRSWECYGGILGRTLKWMYYQTLQDRFADWCRDVKTQSEKVYNEFGP
ncbi:MAG: hypothetical protein GOMPHAMPRED_000617 [Gomphillus americanus]|uniref:Uncharacterized protein n=1 Tax=Gomphillus americanus TaxID=1940652 RepID=A0A8H3I446_9LECA|nr:MAG: hypothetical protein GOMPHAMPRED_000617 [Gomphillus americanus]